jgi:hypothetical protein
MTVKARDQFNTHIHHFRGEKPVKDYEAHLIEEAAKLLVLKLSFNPNKPGPSARMVKESWELANLRGLATAAEHHWYDWSFGKLQVKVAREAQGEEKEVLGYPMRFVVGMTCVIGFFSWMIVSELYRFTSS